MSQIKDINLAPSGADKISWGFVYFVISLFEEVFIIIPTVQMRTLR